MPKEFIAKNYATRKDLEAAIRAEVGTDIRINKEAGHIIRGTRKEMKRLHLSDTTMIYGCKCVITDTPTAEMVKIKPKKRKK